MDEEEDYRNFLDHYHEIGDAMKLAAQRYACGCEGPMIDLREGCLQTVIAREVLLNLAHALADAAKVETISYLYGSKSAESLSDQTIIFLNDIRQYGTIHWREWFVLSAIAATGTLRDLVSHDHLQDSDRGDLVAWIAGSTTVVPRWFGFDKKINMEHSWGIDILTGTIANVTSDEAVILTQIEGETEELPKLAPDILPLAGCIDDCDITIASLIIAKDKSVYRL